MNSKMGSALMGSLQSSCFLTGTFWVLPLTCFYLPKSARAYLFPQSVKIHYFCSSPISVDPICPQPISGFATALSQHTLRAVAAPRCHNPLATRVVEILRSTPGLHNKIPAHKIFARVWVAHESFCLHYQR